MRAPPIIALLGLLCLSAVYAAPVDDARQLWQQGNATAALQQLEMHLVDRPDDTQGRFLKGVILSEQNRTAEAIDVFRALIRDYPELAEPYNNLAVLLAAQGDYHGAREALDMAVRVKPDYATAYVNLGDVHAHLALQAYEHAAGLDGAPRSLRGKLQLARQLTVQAEPSH